jgi:hypothetical protein
MENYECWGEPCFAGAAILIDGNLPQARLVELQRQFKQWRFYDEGADIPQKNSENPTTVLVRSLVYYVKVFVFSAYKNYPLEGENGK